MRKINLYIMLVLILAACASPTPTVAPTSLPTATATAVPPTSTPTETLPPTPTPTITATPMPESTPTPEVQVPGIMVPTQTLDELVPANFPNKESLFLTFNGQFKYKGGLDLDLGNYYLWCIAAADMFRHQPPLEMAGGDIVTHSIPCQYRGPDGEEHIVLIPAFSANVKEGWYQILGHNRVTQENIGETADMNDIVRNLMELEIGPFNFLKNSFGYTGKGNILLVSFRMPSTDLTGDFLLNSQRELYTPELLAEFARTGNPELLPHQLLFPKKQPFWNSLQAAMNDAND